MSRVTTLLQPDVSCSALTATKLRKQGIMGIALSKGIFPVLNHNARVGPDLSSLIFFTPLATPHPFPYHRDPWEKKKNKNLSLILLTEVSLLLIYFLLCQKLPVKVFL